MVLSSYLTSAIECIQTHGFSAIGHWAYKRHSMVLLLIQGFISSIINIYANFNFQLQGLPVFPTRSLCLRLKRQNSWIKAFSQMWWHTPACKYLGGGNRVIRSSSPSFLAYELASSLGYMIVIQWIQGWVKHPVRPRTDLKTPDSTPECEQYWDLQTQCQTPQRAILYMSKV